MSNEIYMVGVEEWENCAHEVAPLRVRAWKDLTIEGMPGKGLVSLTETIDLDPRCIHFVCRNDQRVVGAARLVVGFLSESILDHVEGVDISMCSLLSRLVVDPDHRRRGIARMIQENCIERAKQLGYNQLWTEASPTTVNGFGQLGFDIIERYFEAEAIFVRQQITIMRKQLTAW